MMRASDLAAVAFLVLGLHLLIGIPTSAVSTYWLFSEAHEHPDIYGAALPQLGFLIGFIYLAVIAGGLSLIGFRRRLGLAAFPLSDSPSALPGSNAVDLASALLAAAGVWFAVTAIRDSSYGVTEFVIRRMNPAYGPGDDNLLAIWPKRTALALQFFGGAAMFFGSHGLAEFWHRLRTVGHEKHAV